MELEKQLHAAMMGIDLDPSDERDRLVGDENSYSLVFRYYRAAGTAICLKCGEPYEDHPVVRPKEKNFYGCELHVLCNSDRVKT